MKKYWANKKQGTLSMKTDFSGGMDRVNFIYNKINYPLTFL